MATAVTDSAEQHAGNPETTPQAELDSQGAHGVKCSPFRYAEPAVQKPCTTCSLFCGGLLIFLLILMGLTGAGVEVIRFADEVPFYLYDYTVYKEQVSIKSAFDVAAARLDGDLREREQLESDFQLKIIYESEDGSTLFSADILAGIKAMEEKVVAVADYATFCALKYDFNSSVPICVRHDSAVSFFDPAWWVPALDPPSQPTVASEYNAELVMNRSTIASFDRDNYYAFADPQDLDRVDEVDLSQDNIDELVEYWAGYCSDADDCPAAANGADSPYAMTISGTNVTVSNQIVTIVDTDFSIQGEDVETTAKALLSVFYFGSPQYNEDEGELYDVDTQGMVDQTEELGEFLIDEVAGILEDGVDGIKVFWSGDGNGMLELYQSEILASDMTLLVFSILFIVVYLIFQLRSWWLGGMGLLMILGNFGPALIVYRLLYGSSYFGTLNALVIFLALGIGADDIFVFANTWKHIRCSQPEMPVVQQLRQALAISGKAMLVTSVTTTLSFLVNASSHFPAVQSFGVFSAVVVASNFVLVITLYPAAYMVYEYYMFDSDKRRGFIQTACHGCRKTRSGYAQPQGAGSEVSKGSSLTRFFQLRFYPFLHRFRLTALAIFAGVIVAYIMVGSQLEPDSESPQLLPDSDQYMQVQEKLETYFSHSDTSDAVTVKIPFGIAGIDRDDCDGDPCDPTISTDYGAPIWDTGLQDLSNEYTQKWFLDFCNAIESAADTDNTLMVYEADESNPTPVSCPFQGFQTWCEQGTGRCNQTHSILGTDEYIVDASSFDETFLTFLTDELPVSSENVFSTESTNYDVWDDQIRYETSSDGSVTLRYVSIEVLLSARYSLDYNQGVDMYHEWGDFLEEWQALAETDEYEGADTAVGSGFVNDDSAFHWFFLQERIILEAFQGIALSLFGVFVVLCLATTNWRISVMATFTIGTMVGGVVSFTVINGWKLGVLEAILFVMVIGFSVDYTIHLSDAYLESTKKTRGERTQDMLATMGPSVLSGAISTMGACFPLFFATFVFFLKFGTVIFFIIAQSLVFSLVFYAAMLDIMGPEPPAWGGKIKKGRQVIVKMDFRAEANDSSISGVTSNNADAHEGTEELYHGKVLATDSETCTVLLEGSAREVCVSTSHCRLRYEGGHISLVNSCTKTLSRYLRGCYRSKKPSVVELDGPMQGSREPVA